MRDFFPPWKYIWFYVNKDNKPASVGQAEKDLDGVLGGLGKDDWLDVLVPQDGEGHSQDQAVGSYRGGAHIIDDIEVVEVLGVLMWVEFNKYS